MPTKVTESVRQPLSTGEKKQLIQDKFKTYWRKEDKRKAVEKECTRLKTEILELAKSLPDTEWKGKTYRADSTKDCIRLGARTKINFPDSDFNKEEWMKKNRKYCKWVVDDKVLTAAIEVGGNKKLDGFSVERTETVKLEKS